MYRNVVQTPSLIAKVKVDHLQLLSMSAFTT